MLTEVVAARTMNSLYIWLDIGFLCLLLMLLEGFKRRGALIAGLLGGILYFLVDYGVFYLWLGTRTVTGADTFWFLLWLSMSYGFTNFAWIWLWLDRDPRALEWSLLIVAGWLCTALLSQGCGAGFTQISIARGTAGYHGIMAVLLFAGYGLLCVMNLRRGGEQAPLVRLLAIGILVQFCWEFVLAVTGIRNVSLQTILVNSLLETNMGLPYLYLIHRWVTTRFPGRVRPADPA